MKLLVLSDIHGNLGALDAVLMDSQEEDLDGLLLLGDMIDYGPRSNEVVERLASLDIPLMTAVWGNHEKAALDGDYSRFSSQRGRECMRITAESLTDATKVWLKTKCDSRGLSDFSVNGIRCLAIHGSIADPYWKSVDCASVNAADYANYDVVFSGHNHVPHAFIGFYTVNNSRVRNKRRVQFVNPGSVGQPRDRDPRAHYAVFDSSRGVELRVIDYDITAEQALFDDAVDTFYRERLSFGV